MTQSYELISTRATSACRYIFQNPATVGLHVVESEGWFVQCRPDLNYQDESALFPPGTPVEAKAVVNDTPNQKASINSVK